MIYKSWKHKYASWRGIILQKRYFMHRDYVIYHNSQGHQLTSLRERPHKEAQEMCVVLCHGRSVGKDEL